MPGMDPYLEDPATWQKRDSALEVKAMERIRPVEDKIEDRLHFPGPILPLVFYTGKRAWKKLPTLFSLMEVPKWETLFLNLHETPPQTLAACRRELFDGLSATA